MNLGSKYLDEVIDLDQFPIVSLVVEHPGIYYSILKSTVLGGGPELVFSEFDTPKDLTSVVELVTDPFSLTLADKKMDSLLSKKLLSLYERDHFQDRLNASLSELLDIFREVSLDLPFPIEFNEGSTAKDVLKLLSPKIGIESEGKLESILQYIDSVNVLTKKAIFLFASLKSILTEDEYRSLAMECRYKKLNLITIEPKMVSYSLDGERAVRIDSDLCCY